MTVQPAVDEPIAPEGPENAAEEAPPAAPRGWRRFSSPDRNVRWASRALVAYAIVGGLAVLTNLGTYRWFLADEWDFLADRSITDLGDLMRDHNQHWSFLPILVYRALFQLFGLNTYVPYQLAVVLLHLSIVFLIRAVMRRAGIDPWIATAAAAVMVLYGPGDDNIVWGFQIGFTGAVMFGLSQMLLADHEGPFDRRDLFALLCGLGSLLCSGVAPAMIAMTGLVCLVRRGWRLAAIQTVPLGLVYITWYAAIRPEQPDPGRTPGLTELTVWLRGGTFGSFQALSHFLPLTIVVVAILLGGWTIAVIDRGRAQALRDGVGPLALVVGFFAMQLTSFPGRWFLGAEGAQGSRYLYILAVTSLPAIAFGADALARRWRWMVPVTMVVLLVPIPWHIQEFEPVFFDAPYYQSVKKTVVQWSRSPYIRQVPRSVRPDPNPYTFGDTSAGWLVDATDAGLIPDDVETPFDIFDDQTMKMRFGIAQYDEPIPAGLNCRDEVAPLTFRPKVGDKIGVTSNVDIRGVTGGQEFGWPMGVNPGIGGQVLLITLPDLEFTVRSTVSDTSYTICT